MKKVLRQNFAFLIPYFLFLLVAGIFLSLNTKADAHLFLNRFHWDFGNYFFYGITFLGDGAAVAAIVVLLCFFKYRFALLAAASNFFSFLITQGLKHLVFDDVVRPKKFFEGIAELNLVPWVENHMYNSFPSGHTTAAFATFFCLALILNNQWWKLMMFVVALCIGLSRVYLSEHFLNDVIAGSLIGVIPAMLIYRFLFFSGKMQNRQWPEKSFLKRK